MRAEFGGQIARQLEIGRLGNVIGADRVDALRPPTDETMTIEPSLRAIICGATKEISQ
jgi:hypothetical protein